MIKLKMVDVVVSTGAIIYQDIYQARGFKHFVGNPDADDRQLDKLYIDRIYDTYVDDEKFWDKKRDIVRRDFNKTGSETILLGGKLAGKVIIRVVSEKAFFAWKKALESDIWKKEGFDYIKQNKTPVQFTVTGVLFILKNKLSRIEGLRT